jgi:hypothetical protein
MEIASQVIYVPNATMPTIRSRRRALLTVISALALVLVPLGSADTSYSDLVGDSPGLDIGAVTVSDVAGVVTFDVAVALVPSSALFVGIDNDRNPATGAGGYAWGLGVRLTADGSKEAFAFVPALGVEVPIPVLGSVIANRAEISVSARDVGIEDAFDFSLVAARDDLDEADDVAPDSGNWTYRPGAALSARPVLGRGAAVPSQPVAGKRFTVTFPVTSGDGSPFARATVSSTTKIAGRVVRNTHSYASGRARVTLVVPKAARGKRLQLTVRVTAAGKTASKKLTYTIR